MEFLVTSEVILLLFPQILNRLFVIVFFPILFGFFEKNNGYFSIYYFDSQTKICFEEIKTSSKFSEKKIGIRENKIHETI